MNRTSAIFSAVLLGLMLGSAAGAKPLNVLFVVVDDLRPELGCYGNDEVRTPNIDRLAQRGILFNRAYAQYPVCNPSRSSFLSGKRPDELGIYENRMPVRKKCPEVVTLPQLFRNNGYFTAGLGKVLCAGTDEQGEFAQHRDDLSYDHFFTAKDSPIGKKGEERIMGDGSIPWAFWRAAEGGDEAQADGLLASEAVRVLEAHQEEPFFIGVGFHKPHDPFVAPKEYFDLYPLENVKLADEPADRSPLNEYALTGGFGMFKDRDHREFKRAYHACTTYVDSQIGKVLDTLDRLHLWDSTIVVLLGDHGYHLGEHNHWNKVTVFELGARAPLMLWMPGMDSMGQETDSIVEFLDLYPTLADLCGLKAPLELSGKSLRPVLENPSNPWKNVAYTQVARDGIHMGYSIRTDRWRLIQWGATGEGGYELYDHSRDGGEYYNLADHPEYRRIKKQLVGLLDAGFPGIGE
jgi:uncharacterized sulfatase